jgi:hypothetical protein
MIVRLAQTHKRSETLVATFLALEAARTSGESDMTLCRLLQAAAASRRLKAHCSAF